MSDWFRNGYRLQLAQLVIGLTGLLVVVAVYFTVRNQLVDREPVTVASVGVQEARQNGRIVYDLTFCNTADKIVDVSYSLHMIKADPTGDVEVVLPQALQLTASVSANQCSKPPIHGQTLLPKEVDPGAWKLRIVAIYSGLAIKAGTSASFQVEGS